MSHGDSVARLPQGFSITARTETCPVAAISNPERKLYGVQFHPEVRHTLAGMEVLHNFLYEVCGLKGDWNLSDFITETVEAIRRRVGDKKVLCGLSGGVDSSVAAVLVHKAVGDQLVCVYVDNGLMRKGESEQVIETFREQMKMNLCVCRCRGTFPEKIAGCGRPGT
jgi:GMP synthase (glutamine-hydrolysing)